MKVNEGRTSIKWYMWCDTINVLMPSRNILKLDTPNSYYHVYFRGVNRQPIFVDDEDRRVLLNLFKRYLSGQKILSKQGVVYTDLSKDVELCCYCLMTNHVHMLLYQHKVGGMSSLMRSIMTSYSRYFNVKYKRSGPLFESRYKASSVLTQSYLIHISRYIHLNPKDWQSHPYSSIKQYLGQPSPDWLKPLRILDLFEGDDYRQFVSDYEDHKAMLDEIKYDLADKKVPYHKN